VSTLAASVAPVPGRARLERQALVAAVVGVVAFVVAAFTPAAGPHPLTQAFTSYLVAFTFWLAMPLGCLVILMIHYLSGGAWGVLVRPILEAATRTLPLIAVLFVPVAASFFLGSASPFPWARPLEETASGEALEDMKDHAYLMNPPFAAGRAVVYFTVWLLLVYLLNRWSAQWRRGDAAAGPRLPGLSGPGLVLFGVFITFAAIDWCMSLEPYWTSSMFPPLYAMSQIDEAAAFAIIALVLLSGHPPLRGRVLPKHLRDLGGLFLTFIIFWSYFAFVQFLQIWAGNLPEETPYYLKRMRGGWQWVGLSLMLLHFFVPFLLLLFRDIKDRGPRLAWVAVGILVMQWLDTFWWIEAAFPHQEGPGLYWLSDVAATVGLGGIWVWYLARVLRHTSLEPVHGENECSREGVRYE
jgi:hypothetical protein